jgi:hypothetical protein
MIRLIDSLRAWGSPDFVRILRDEVERLPAAALPLQQGLSTGSYALDSQIRVMINHVSDDAAGIHVRAGVFYSSVLAGCSCADDPTPVSENSEYCEVRLDISKKTGETAISLLADDRDPD